jgi:transposase-like protein
MTEGLPVINLASLGLHFSDEEEAYKLLEQIRWPHGPICPHCGFVGEAYYLNPKGEGRKTRTGKISGRRVWKCKSCRKQFSVTVGTVMEGSKVPLPKWLLAVHLMCASKNGVAAYELHRTIGVSQQTAWFMCHRIRYAMTRSPLSEKLGMRGGEVASVSAPVNRLGASPLVKKVLLLPV